MPTSRYARSFLGPDAPRTGILFLLISAVVVAAGVYHAAVLRWLSDDIFITFRYVDQWFSGNGLVYNPGEYVEGYTHPLWLLLLSAWRLIGLDMVWGSQLLGLMSHGMLLGTLVYVSWRLAGRAGLAFPASAASVALHYDSAVWATGGLETALFTFLVTLSVVILTIADLPEKRRLLGTGSVLVLAVLTRPDGVLIFATVGVLVAARSWAEHHTRKEMVARLAWFASPSLIGVPYALWKLAYYGNLLPNTYYAKSGGGAHFEQGFTYIALFFEGHPSSWLALAGLLALVFAQRRPGRGRERLRSIFADRTLHVTLVCSVMSLVYILLFVARVGGDFMYARFIIPIVPLLYISAEAALRRLLARRQRLALAALVLVPLTVGTVDVWSRDKVFNRDGASPGIPGDGTTGIVDEHYFWTVPFGKEGENLITVLRGVGDTLHSYWDGLPVRILIRGQACLAYYAKPFEVIENWGLTDPFIAQMEIVGRGRVGHEKSAPVEYILARRVHFFFFKEFTPADTSYYRIVEFDLPYGWGNAEMHFYDRELMTALQERIGEKIRFVDFEEYLDSYIETSGERSREELEQAFADFKSFYFNHNFDPEREKKFLEALRIAR